MMPWWVPTYKTLWVPLLLAVFVWLSAQVPEAAVFAHLFAGASLGWLVGALFARFLNRHATHS